MSTTFDTTAFDKGTDPILRFFTREQAEAIANYRGEDELRQRIEYLADKANEGDLTDRERSEYEGYLQANKFVAILQAKARRFLARTTS